MTAEESGFVDETSFDKVRRKLVAARIGLMGQLAKCSKKALSQPAAEGEWSPLQIAYHLYISDGLLLEQMRHVQEEDNPLIEDIEVQAPHLTETSEPPVSLDAVLAGMAARREEIFEYLASLPADAWERPFRHKLWGDRKFYQLANVLPCHDQIHTQQLEAILAAQAV